jgi:ABC-type phosphate transport system, permease component
MSKPKKSPIKRRAIREAVEAGLEKRRRRDRRLRRLGLAAILLGLGFLAFMFASIAVLGYGAFWQTRIQLEIHLDAGEIDPEGTRDPTLLAQADYQGLIKRALRERFPQVRKRRLKRQLYKLVSSGAAWELRNEVLANPALVGSRQKMWITADDDVDVWFKHPDLKEYRLSEAQQAWLRDLEQKGQMRKFFNTAFFQHGDSREPEQAGILGALMGSLYAILVTLGLSLPLGIAAAIYLEEFAPRNRWTDFIEVNINNLAAVPSIVFGLLGLAVFINFLGMPRSAPLVGGLVLTLMTLPTIIIAGRAALKSVPPPSGRRRWASAHPGCRQCSTTCCPWPCRACSPAPSSAWPRRWARPPRCS